MNRDPLPRLSAVKEAQKAKAALGGGGVHGARGALPNNTSEKQSCQRPLESHSPLCPKVGVFPCENKGKATHLEKVKPTESCCERKASLVLTA